MFFMSAKIVAYAKYIIIQYEYTHRGVYPDAKQKGFVKFI